MNKIIANKLILVAILPLLLQSCFTAKTYERPSVETENLYRTDNLPQDSISFASVSYKDLFTDTYLRTYIERGLQNNLDIRIALQNIAAAEAYVKQGKAGYLPTLNGAASATRTARTSENGQFGSFFTQPFNQFETSGTLSWEADIWGKIRSTKRASDASYLQTVAAHRVVKTSLVSQIATTYYQLLALDKQISVTEETIETRSKSLETITALKEAGQENQVGVDQTAAQLYSAQSQLLDLKNALYKTENTLSILLSEAPQDYDRGTLDDQKLSANMQLGVPALLLRNRPDIMQAEYGLVNSFELTNVARSNFYPSITLSAQGGFQSLELDNWIDSSSIFANLVGGLTQPIFNGRKVRTAYEVAKAQQEQSLLSFKQSLLVAGKEVSEALYDYNISVEKEAFVSKQVVALKRAEDNSEELLNSGYLTYLDLLTARENSLNAELSLVDNKLDQLSATVELYRSLGGGWQ
ncbi:MULTISPECIES: TolC family protein [Maribacter]|uniref:Efflux transporter, outer membrane factor (OMF) lipoprotein, NodT family n=3 Tax=Maribacter dokdonensis TaxID=320912 RepID=A0A1H4KJV8_9FLAO|nr:MULTISPECIES: TolC family protein [Maribacter]APA64128.1 membrane protein [Maribacter sp. 1_2014MBL_MicDiv]KSA13032.1 RND efflux system, outer membrane lipoprotein CmeC [Maribacter dokdonensis DSW-8]CAG2535090.1 NodT family [Maribacter dokdonensis]SDT38140.1 efflux transporter, outer membrane factor (OMF) lipoprotein, NodT family [Maribacter dokdonensis]SEB58834.1 efflux transporter, outer membrane factor (OMF) lipoprotein, NodT family [Maribacter dokdonensis]